MPGAKRKDQNKNESYIQLENLKHGKSKSPSGSSRGQEGEARHSRFNLVDDMKRTRDFQKTADDDAGRLYDSDDMNKSTAKYDYVRAEQVRVAFKTMAGEHPERVNMREFMSACHALGVECTMAQIQEVFLEMDRDSKGYISLDDFVEFMKPHPEDDIVKVQRKLQMNITEISTDEEESESSDEFDFGDIDGPSGAGTLETTFGPKYTVNFEDDSIKKYLVSGPSKRNAFVMKLDDGCKLASQVMAGSKVEQIGSYNVIGLPYEQIIKLLSNEPPITIVFKNPRGIPSEELPDGFGKNDSEDDMYELLGSPDADIDTMCTTERMKAELPHYPLWQYPLLITQELLMILLYWTVPFGLVLAVAFALGPLVCFYKLIRIIWDSEVTGWQSIKRRHFTGVFERVGNYLENIRIEKVKSNKRHSQKISTVGAIPSEPSTFAAWFVKFSCVSCGDWTVKQVIDFMGQRLSKNWVLQFEKLRIDGSELEKYQTIEQLETINPDPEAPDSLKRRRTMSKRISKQFNSSVGLKIAKSIQALLYSLFLGPMLILWMWTAWIRRTIDTSPIHATSPLTRIFHSPLPDQDDCWPKLRHSPRRDTWRIRVFLTMEDESYSLLSYFITIIIMLLIFVSTAAYVFQTLPEYENNDVWEDIEWVVSICFTLEYGIRILMCRNMWAYFVDLMNMIDFLAVIPFWIEYLSTKISGSGTGGGGSLLRVIRVIRLARVVRLLKSKRFAEYLEIFRKTLEESAESFGLLVTIVFLETIIFASLIFVAERGSYDEESGLWLRYDGLETHFVSIPEAAYWCIVTMTTVGYGDQYPITGWGKLIGCITMFTGLLVIALPVIIVGGNFEQVYQDHRKAKELQLKRERIIEAKGEKKLKQNALQRYEEGKRSVVELVMDVNRYLNKPNFLTYEHVQFFLAEDFDSRDRIEAVLRHKHGFAFLPQQIDKYKRFILYENYGKFLRKNNKMKMKVDRGKPAGGM